VSTIAKGDFKSKARCGEFFSKLAEQAGMSISGDQLMDQVIGTATTAVGTVYDGPSSSTALDPTKFPGAASPGVSTVGDWFRADDRREALSQYNGSAVFIRGDAWGGFFSSYDGKYGLGTLMHELLHKQTVGGGFTHDQMANALSAIGMGAGDYTLGHNRNSDQIGRLCF
jgi:hypothetical protein